MNETAWGWALLGAELAGLAAMSQLVGRRRLWWGWMIVFLCVSVPWLTYSLITTRWSFLILSLLWAAVHITNANKWRNP
ncbi:hypothetical protein UFOVP209_38 [uncultured Caudovirales phage]|uniref:Uncharacterized protein n=1 Tax=uncultured Caudovirales phage TaxID=2100421 RepID=A0A6J7WJ16_9CAUD|nr:hypothetical protein UFOVP209_38 [uncultured Caudovirales phage]